MYVLQIHKYYQRRGGAEHYMLGVERLLRDAGHETGIFAVESRHNLRPAGLSRFVPGRDLEDASRSFLERALLAPSAVYSRPVALELERFVAQRRPDLVYLHNYHYHLTPSVLGVLKRHNIPAVHMLHDYHIVCPNHNLYDTNKGEICEACANRRFMSPVERRCREGSLAKSAIGTAELALWGGNRLYYEAVRHYLSPSRFLIGKMREMGFQPPRFDHMPNFVDVDAFQPGPKADPPFAVHFAGLHAFKGIETLLKAMAAIPERNLKIAGGGPLLDKYRDAAEDLRLGNVEFTGFLTGGALKELISAAAVSVQSAEWYENCPLSVLESYACGTPVLAAKIGGLPELIVPGETGELFPMGDEMALAEGIAGYLSDSDKCERQGLMARKLAEEKYGAEDHLRMLMYYFRMATENE